MKRLLSVIPFVCRKRVSGIFDRRSLLRAGVGIVALLAFPLTMVYAQEFTGTVSCVETYSEHYTDPESLEFYSIENEYPVILDGALIIDRWGTDKNVVYRTQMAFKRPGDFMSILLDEDIDVRDYFSNLTVNFWTMPASRFGTCGSDQICLEMEELYSETGTWGFKLKKDQLQINGTSYVTMEFPFEGDPGWTNLAAKCTWNLSGLLSDF